MIISDKTTEKSIICLASGVTELLNSDIVVEPFTNYYIEGKALQLNGSIVVYGTLYIRSATLELLSNNDFQHNITIKGLGKIIIRNGNISQQRPSQLILYDEGYLETTNSIINMSKVEASDNATIYSQYSSIISKSISCSAGSLYLANSTISSEDIMGLEQDLAEDPFYFASSYFKMHVRGPIIIRNSYIFSGGPIIISSESSFNVINSYVISAENSLANVTVSSQQTVAIEKSKIVAVSGQKNAFITATSQIKINAKNMWSLNTNFTVWCYGSYFPSPEPNIAIECTNVTIMAARFSPPPNTSASGFYVSIKGFNVTINKSVFIGCISTSLCVNSSYFYLIDSTVQNGGVVFLGRGTAFIYNSTCEPILSRNQFNGFSLYDQSSLLIYHWLTVRAIDQNLVPLRNATVIVSLQSNNTIVSSGNTDNNGVFATLCLTGVMTRTGNDVTSSDVGYFAIQAFNETYSTSVRQIYMWQATYVSWLPTNLTINLSSPKVRIGQSVTIWGTMTPKHACEVIGLYYRIKGENEWKKIEEPLSFPPSIDEIGNYNYTWTPKNIGTLEIYANWSGDSDHCEAQASLVTLTVESDPFYLLIETLKNDPALLIFLILIATFTIVFIVITLRKHVQNNRKKRLA